MATARAAIVPVTPFQQNCTLVWSDATKVGAVVDPGGDVERIRGAIAQAGITIEKILITHGHIDHAGGAAELAEALGVPVEGPHKADAALLATLPASGLAFGITGARALTPDRWLEEGDTVTVSDLVFSVLHCPGHSPGSVVLFNVAIALFVLSAVGIGLVISSIAKTQQQAILGVFLFLSPAMVLSGFTTPIANMPDWAQALTHLNPIRYMVTLSRGIFLQDLPWALAWPQLWPMALIGCVTLGYATWLFSRRLE